MTYPLEVRKRAVALVMEGGSCREAGEAVGVHRETVRLWVKAARPAADPGEGSADMPKKTVPVVGDGPIYPDIDPEDKDAIIARLRLENDILRGMQEILKGASLSSATNREKSLLIEWLRRNTSHRLRELTDFLRISKSTYEYWRVHLHDGDVRDEIADDVRRIFEEEGRCARGYRFVHAVLVSERGEPISEKIVRDSMRDQRLSVIYSKRGKKYSSYEGETDEAPANMPLREDGTHDFHADGPDEKWVTDITEFKLPDAPKVYLSPIIDLFDGKPVAWSIGLHPDAELANSSLAKAIGRASRMPLWVHSDYAEENAKPQIGISARSVQKHAA